MSNKQHVYLLIFVLFFSGLALFFYRALVLEVPLNDNKTENTWMVEANLRFHAERNKPVKATFNIPYMPPYYAILDEYFVAPHYGITTNLKAYNRETVWSLRRSQGMQSLYYRAIFREVDDNFPSSLKKPLFTKNPPLEENKKTAVDNILRQARESSADIQTFAQSIIKELNKHEGNTKILMEDPFNEAELVNTAVLILSQSKINALMVKGLQLEQQTKAKFKHYLAVYNGQSWIYIEPHSGSAGLPKNFLTWQYGSAPLFEVQGGKKASFNLSVSPTPVNALNMAKARGLQFDSKLLHFSLLQLPVHLQETYKVLLMVPVGAFIILILRNFLGLKTFGTFMPVLIALAFRETRIIWGITLFTFIVSVGLLIRFYLDQLRLLLVPRLASILTIVILLMIFISILSQHLGLDAGLSIALFPMVILTMIIERMCISWDERGAGDALKSGMGSLLAAVIAFSVMNYPPLEYLVFAFPELLLILLGLILWFGQYRGYRLTELFRFEALSRD